MHLTVPAYGCNPKKCWSGMDFAQKERQWTYLYSCLMFSTETFYCSKIILWYITSMNKIIWSIITNKITVHRHLIQVIQGISCFHFVLKKHNPVEKKRKIITKCKKFFFFYVQSFLLSQWYMISCNIYRHRIIAK